MNTASPSVPGILARKPSRPGDPQAGGDHGGLSLEFVPVSEWNRKLIVAGRI